MQLVNIEETIFSRTNESIPTQGSSPPSNTEDICTNTYFVLGVEFGGETATKTYNFS